MYVMDCVQCRSTVMRICFAYLRKTVGRHKEKNPKSKETLSLVLDKQSADIKIPNKLRNNSISFWTEHVQNLNVRFQKKLVAQNTLLLINFGDVSLLLIKSGGLKRTFFNTYQQSMFDLSQ